MRACIVELAKIAPLMTTLLAASAVDVASTQLGTNRAKQRETTAKGVFREYLKHAFDHPQFATPDYAKLRQAPDEYEKYSWFVAYLLWTSEEMLRYADSYGKDTTWKRNVQ